MSNNSYFAIALRVRYMLKGLLAGGIKAISAKLGLLFETDIGSISKAGPPVIRIFADNTPVETMLSELLLENIERQWLVAIERGKFFEIGGDNDFTTSCAKGMDCCLNRATRRRADNMCKKRYSGKVLAKICCLKFTGLGELRVIQRQALLFSHIIAHVVMVCLSMAYKMKDDLSWFGGDLAARGSSVWCD